jgi:hypothetical protein
MTYLEYVISKYEDKCFGKWEPDKRFYEKVGINQKRFGMLVRNEIEMLLSEAKSLVDFFGLDFEIFCNCILSGKEVRDEP